MHFLCFELAWRSGARQILCHCFLLALLSGTHKAQAAPSPQPVTRASNLGILVAGLGMSMTMPDYLTAYPNARTSIFAYLKLDGGEVESMVGYLDLQVAAQEEVGRDFWPQVTLETGHLNMAAFRRELARPESLVSRNVRLLASNIARYRDQNKRFFIRAFCEMNDATLENPWEFANPRYNNTPADFAAAWKLLRDVFDAEGATNAIFVFSPLAAHNVHHEKEVLATLNLIPTGYIDAYGINVYSRPLTAYGGTSPQPIPFATLVQPWIDLLARSKHHGIPLAAPEMGVSNQADDTLCAAWLRAAFRFARAHNFVLMTYFNYAHRYWQIAEGTQAGDALRAGIDAAPLAAPHPVAVTPHPVAASRPAAVTPHPVAVTVHPVTPRPLAVPQSIAAAPHSVADTGAPGRNAAPPGKRSVAGTPSNIDARHPGRSATFSAKRGVAGPPPNIDTGSRPQVPTDALDLANYHVLSAVFREEYCDAGDGLAVIIDPDMVPEGKLPYARIDRVVGRRRVPATDQTGLDQVVRGGEDGDSEKRVVESAWLKLKRLADGRIALLWERSADGGPAPGEYEIRYYLSESHLSESRLPSDIRPRELIGVQRLHCAAKAAPGD